MTLERNSTTFQAGVSMQMPPPSAPDNSAGAKVAADGVPSKPHGLSAWLIRRHEIRRVEAELKSISAEQRGQVSHARHALELADHLVEPRDPLRTGPGHDLALSLYRQAAYWALRAAGAQGHSLREAFESADAELLKFASADAVNTVRDALVTRSFVESAAMPHEAIEKDAQLAQAFVHGLLDRLDGPERRLRRLRLAAVIRVGVLLLVVLGPVIAGGYVAVWHLTRKPDLAAGKPWKSSSEYEGFDATSGVVDGNKTKLFFHTNRQNNPWVEFDLGQQTTISEVEIRNRRDCCRERAVPLVVELSIDRTNWREVAKRDRDFRTWTPSFAPQAATYVRVRALKKTYFHLESVRVHP